jgi:tubulin epsilon
MPETLTISIGQAGNQIASQFWELSLQEQAHYIGNKVPIYDDSLATFFRHADTSKGIGNIPVIEGDKSKIRNLKARGLLVDMEQGVVGGIQSSPLGEIFDPHQIILSNSGSGNNWGQGYHYYGELFKDQITESLRKEAEFCDSLQSIITIQSSVLL